jgi:hypothetical protein
MARCCLGGFVTWCEQHGCSNCSTQRHGDHREGANIRPPSRPASSKVDAAARRVLRRAKRTRRSPHGGTALQGAGARMHSAAVGRAAAGQAAYGCNPCNPWLRIALAASTASAVATNIAARRPLPLWQHPRRAPWPQTSRRGGRSHSGSIHGERRGHTINAER